MKKQEIRYTVVLHDPRLELKLSVAEYCIADSIYHLSNNPSSKLQGWCYASKETLADFIGITPRSVYNILNKLISIGLVDKDDDTKHLRTTQLWYDKVVLMELKTEYEKTSQCMNKVQKECKESSVKGMKKFQSDYEKTSHYNNTITTYNNNTNKNTSDSKESQELNKKISECFTYWKDINPFYKDWFGNKTQRGAMKKLLTEVPLEATEWILKNLNVINSTKFMPDVSTPWAVLKNFSKIVSQIKKEYKSSGTVVDIDEIIRQKHNKQ